MNDRLVPLGYMAKRISERPESVKTPRVQTVHSVSSHVSDDFCDFINHWKHNGYWLFDSPEVICQLASDEDIDLSSTVLHFYRGCALEFDESTSEWAEFSPFPNLETSIVLPKYSSPVGFDVVTYSNGNMSECSPLSCNALADEISTNEFCLLDTFEEAIDLLESDRFANTEPGPFRVIEVSRVEWSHWLSLVHGDR